MERFLVPRAELPDILDKHADKVVERLSPRLDSIDKELKKGSQRFEAHGKELEAIKIECAARKATCPGQNPAPRGNGPEEEENSKWGAKDITLKIGLPTVGGGAALSVLGWVLYKLIEAGVFG